MRGNPRQRFRRHGRHQAMADHPQDARYSWSRRDGFSAQRKMRYFMLKRQQLSRDDALYAIENGDFSASLLSAGPNVAVVMSQDWCSQWTAMRSWLKTMEKNIAGVNDDITVFEFVYNQIDIFHQFLDLKENSWGNRFVPYIRYYRGGELIGESNYISADDFVSRFS